MVEYEYKDMEKGQKEARIGLDSEEDIINMINTNARFRESLRKCIVALGFNVEKEISAYKDNIKTDIIIRIDDEIGISVKSSTKTSFHQLDRRRLEDWKTFTSMPDDIFEIMKEAILRISRNPKDKFIRNEDREKIAGFFSQHLRAILDEVFRKGEEKLKLLLINDKQARKIFIFRMDEVLDFLYKNAYNKIRFTDKGIIMLGDFITIQRKGGDGKHIKIPKTDWEHPGNQLQFKFSPLKFAKYCEENNVIRFYVVEY
jgi:hypothetical protein